MVLEDLHKRKDLKRVPKEIKENAEGGAKAEKKPQKRKAAKERQPVPFQGGQKKKERRGGGGGEEGGVPQKAEHQGAQG